MEKIAIFGGTFNPVHNEHVYLANLAVKELGLDRLIIMPTYSPPHKNAPTTSAEDRLNMLKLAFDGQDKISVSDYEIKKQGTSYTYQTVEYFKNQSERTLYFIVGGDMLENFKTWRYPERILNACELVAFGREDSTVDFEKEKEYFRSTFNKQFISLPYIGKCFSSTEIRVYNSLGLSIEDKVPVVVANYIKDKGLFLGDKYYDFIKKVLPEKRLKHTADVIVTALEKAKQIGIDCKKVELACLLHDVAKYIDYKTVKGFTLPNGVPKPVEHAYLGAYIVENELGITDQDVINAVRYHTSGRAGMSDLEKLVFVADMVEKGRSYQGVEKLREFFKGDLHECFKECIKEELIHLLNKKEYIYAETLNAYDFYVKGNKEN